MSYCRKCGRDQIPADKYDAVLAEARALCEDIIRNGRHAGRVGRAEALLKRLPDPTDLGRTKP